VCALDFDRLKLLGLDLDELVLADLVASTLVVRVDGSNVSESMSCCFSRLPVFLLICRNETRSAADDAG
jgi:hypothetical protein